MEKKINHKLKLSNANILLMNKIYNKIKVNIKLRRKCYKRRTNLSNIKVRNNIQ